MLFHLFGPIIHGVAREPNKTHVNDLRNYIRALECEANFILLITSFNCGFFEDIQSKKYA